LKATSPFDRVGEQCDESLEEYLQAGTRNVNQPSKIASASYSNGGYIAEDDNSIALARSE
jgi:hypothetical protein